MRTKVENKKIVLHEEFVKKEEEGPALCSSPVIYINKSTGSVNFH